MFQLYKMGLYITGNIWCDKIIYDNPVFLNIFGIDKLGANQIQGQC